MNIHGIIAENLECSHGDVIELVDDSGNVVPPFACKFAPKDGELACVVDEAGNVHLLNIRYSGAKRHVHSFSAHQNAIFDVEWLDTAHVLTASGDLTLRLMDVERRRPVVTFAGHRSTVKCVAVQPCSEYIFVSGARDGSVRLWDVRVRGGQVGHIGERRVADAMRTGTERRSLPGEAGEYPKLAPRAVFEQLHTAAIRGRQSSTLLRSSSVTRLSRRSAGPSRRASLAASSATAHGSASSVTSLLFLGDSTLVSCADSDSLVRMWDTRTLPNSARSAANGPAKLKPKLCVPYVGCSRKRVGYSHLLQDSSTCHLLAVCSDSVVYEFDVLELERNELCRTLAFGDSQVDESKSAPSAVAYYADCAAAGGSFYVRASLSSDGRLLAVGGHTRAAVYSRCPLAHNCASVKATDETSKCASRLQSVLPVATLGGFERCEVSVAEWCPLGTQKLVTLADDGTVRVWRYNRHDCLATDASRSNPGLPWLRSHSALRRPAEGLLALACAYVAPSDDLPHEAAQQDRRNHNLRVGDSRSCLSHSLAVAIARRQCGLPPHRPRRPCTSRSDPFTASATRNMPLVRRFLMPLYRSELPNVSASVFSSPRKMPQTTGPGTFLSPCTPIKMTPKKLHIKESPFKSNSAHRESGSGTKVEYASAMRTPTLVSRMLFGSEGPATRSDLQLAASQDCVDGLVMLGARSNLATLTEPKASLGNPQRIECTYKMQKRARLDGQKTDGKANRAAPSPSSVTTGIARRGRPTKRKITDYFGTNS